jgi:hypothetical protein
MSFCSGVTTTTAATTYVQRKWCNSCSFATPSHFTTIGRLATLLDNISNAIAEYDCINAQCIASDGCIVELYAVALFGAT